MATTPQALTPEQIQQIIAAGRGSSVNIGGTLYSGNWADQGSGQDMQEGPLQSIYGSTGIDQAGQPYYSYDPSGAYTGQGTTKKSQSFFGGLADAFSDPVVLAALGGAGYAGLLGGGGGAAAAGAGDLWAAEMAAAAPASEVAAATAAANAAATAGASGLTAAQIANLAKAGISVAGLLGASNAISNIGATKTTPTPVTYSGGGAGAGYTPDYFSQVQSNYNSLMPNVPRDVASPLQQWYSTEFNPGASVTGSLFGDMVGGTSKTPVVPPIVPVVPKPPVTTVAPSYTSLTKTSTPTDVAKAYSDFIANAGGNTAANRKAATDYLTNLGLTQGQIESSYNAYLNTLPAAGNTYDVLNAKATPANVASAYSAFIKNEGGDTEANRQRAITYLRDIGISEDAIGQAYTTYLSSLPAATKTTAATTTPTTTTTTTTTPTTTAAVTGNTYQGLSATSTPANVAQAYETFVSGSGGDTPENQQVAINYLKDIGLSDEQINQAYNVYVAEAAATPLTTSTGGGMLSGGNVGGGGSSMTGTVAAAAEPSYTTLGASSSPQAIAAAYADFVASAGGDTAANQQVAIDYLTSLGVSQDTIGKAYGLFKGA